MPNRSRYILILLLVACSAWSAAAQADKRPLPRALVLGDSIYAQHARGVSAELKGKAHVVMADYPRELVLNSATAIEHLDMLLGRVDRNGKALPEDKWPVWDLIHFNVGLGDLIHRMPGIESFRVLPIHAGGVVATPPNQYEQNLVELVKRLKQKAPGAKLVWAHTTPIRASRSNVFKLGSEIEYNRIAERVMNQHRVPINDMHAYAKSIMDMDKPASHGADPFSFDKKPIHPPLVEVIARALKIKLDKQEEPANKG